MNKQIAYCKKRFRVAPGFIAASLGVLLCVCSFSPLFAADEKTTGRLIVDDVLARPGKPAMLKARLVQDGLLGVTGLGGETIRFVVMGQHVGTALTGGDGRAFLEYKTQMRGNHPIVGEVDTSHPIPRTLQEFFLNTTEAEHEQSYRFLFPTTCVLPAQA